MEQYVTMVAEQGKINPQYALEQMQKMKDKYGLSFQDFYHYKFILRTPIRRKQMAEKLRNGESITEYPPKPEEALLDDNVMKYISRASKKSGVDTQGIYEEMVYCQEWLGIPFEAFVKLKLAGINNKRRIRYYFKYSRLVSEWKQARHSLKKQSEVVFRLFYRAFGPERLEENKYIRRVCKRNHIRFQEALDDMWYYRYRYHKNYRTCWLKNDYVTSDRRRGLYAGTHDKKAYNTGGALNSIKQNTGMDRETVQKRIDEINSQRGLKKKITVDMYDAYRLDRLSIDEIKALTADKRECDRLRVTVRNSRSKMYKGKSALQSFEKKFNRLRELEEKLLTKSTVEEIARETELMGLKYEDAQMRKYAADYLACKRAFGFLIKEYFTFCIFDTPFYERSQFITMGQRYKALFCMNDQGVTEILDDKYQAYQTYKEDYNRECILVESPEDYPAFKAFFEKHGKMIVKPKASYGGNGIEVLHMDNGTDTEAVFSRLITNNGSIVAEELIDQHPAMMALNPDSVNTVRVHTFFDGKQGHIFKAFLRIGKAGSFVDNSTAGGFQVALDVETGKVISNADSYGGQTYTRHPGSGIEFIHYQLPEWERMKETVLRLSGQLKGLKYAGWDMACDSSGKWIVVEVNVMPSFIGIQAPLHKGIRQEFIALTGAELW